MVSRKSIVNSDYRQNGQPILEKPGPEYDPAASSKKRQRASYKTFRSLKPNQKKNRLKPVRQHIEKFCKDNELSFSELMGYIGRMISYKNKDVKSAAMFSKLAKGEDITTGSEPMPVHEAVALKTYTYSGRSAWQKFVKACKRRNFVIPSR